jgi:tetratricopeptide (TPR) repeat protein
VLSGTVVGIYYAGIGGDYWLTAEKSFTENLEKSIKIGNNRQRGDLNGFLATMYFVRGKYDLSKKYVDDLYQSNDDANKIWASALKAQCLLMEDKHRDALECLKKGGKGIEATTPRPIQASFYGIYTKALLRRHNADGLTPEQSRENLKQIYGKIVSFLDVGHDASTFDAFSGYFGAVEATYALLNSKTDALIIADATQKLRKALKGYSQKVPIGLSAYCRMQGHLYWDKGKTSNAIKSWKKNLTFAKRLALPLEVGIAHYELGRHLLNDKSECQTHLKQANEIFSKLGAAYYVKHVQNVLD